MDSKKEWNKILLQVVTVFIFGWWNTVDYFFFIFLLWIFIYSQEKEKFYFEDIVAVFKQFTSNDSLFICSTKSMLSKNFKVYESKLFLSFSPMFRVQTVKMFWFKIYNGSQFGMKSVSISDMLNLISLIKIIWLMQ